MAKVLINNMIMCSGISTFLNISIWIIFRASSSSQIRATLCQNWFRNANHDLDVENDDDGAANDDDGDEEVGDCDDDEEIDDKDDSCDEESWWRWWRRWRS